MSAGDGLIVIEAEDGTVLTYRDLDDSNLVAPTWSDATSVTWAVLI